MQTGRRCFMPCNSPDLKNTPPERPVPIKVLPDGTGAMAVGIRAELQYHLSPAEIEASENWLWLATLERLPGYSALSHIDGRHGLNFLTILRAEGNDSTPLFLLFIQRGKLRWRRCASSKRMCVTMTVRRSLLKYNHCSVKIAQSCR